MIYLTRRWRRQPSGPVEVDRNHPLGRKVQWAYVPWNGLLATIDGRLKAPTIALANSPSLETRQAGTGLRVQRTGSYTGRGTYYTPEGTLLWDSGPTTAVLFVDGWDPASPPVGLLRISSGDRVHVSSNGSIGLYLYSGTRAATDPGVLAEGFSGLFALSASGSSNVQMHLAGRSVFSGGTSGYNIRRIRGIGAVTVAWPNFVAPLYAEFDMLSDGEHRALNENPWQIFRPRRRRIISLPGEGPPTATTLWDKIDEEQPDDSDYITTDVSSTCEVKLNTVNPSKRTGHRLRYRAEGDGSTVLTVTLMCGETEIASWSHTPPPGVQLFTHLLTQEQAEAITDHSDLRLRFDSN